MRKSRLFFRVSFVILFISFLVSTQASAQASNQGNNVKGVHTYTLVITGLQTAQDAAQLNNDLLGISGVLTSSTDFATGTIVVTAKKGVMPEHLKKVIVAHNGDISAFTEKYE
ncbi:MAG: hypothetical protein FD123_3911 [Bacteroidetes bacterium]|nr:MAG: hypothetical protein FD123_3911 [Bacteroidota bacterium]